MSPPTLAEEAADFRQHRFPQLIMDREGRVSDDVIACDAGYMVQLAERINWLRALASNAKGKSRMLILRRLKKTLAAYKALDAMSESDP